MGFGFFGWVLFLSMFCSMLLPSASQLLPNTDGYFVYEFLKNMGLGPDSVQHFNSWAPFCSWQGVFCDSRQENIVKLVASGLGLSGPILETTVGKLSMLQHLDLSNNQITGLSSDFWSLGSLKSHNLSGNRISGSLPSNVCNFDSIESINLSFNGFGSTIPSGLLNCHSLVMIDLSSNQFNSSLHDGFGAAFPNLGTLNLAGNRIRGRDTAFSQLESLTALNVSGNLFEESMVGFFRGTMEVVDLSRNRFRGCISEVKFGSGLMFLDLSEDEMSGDILDSLSKVKNLTACLVREKD